MQTLPLSLWQEVIAEGHAKMVMDPRAGMCAWRIDYLDPAEHAELGMDGPLVVIVYQADGVPTTHQEFFGDEEVAMAEAAWAILESASTSEG